MKKSIYQDCQIFLTTKHHKDISIQEPFEKILGARIILQNRETDLLGTFTGEVEREGSPLECAKRKCLLAFEDKKCQFALASEGSFGPHPSFPLLPADHEIIYFVDKKRQFDFWMSEVFLDTNYEVKNISTMDELMAFAQRALFPSHALILRSATWNKLLPIYKGIQNEEKLKAVFHEIQSASEDTLVSVETDMRAHVNPTRMSVIEKLAIKMANRLRDKCPKCHLPGWGKIDIEIGLPCKVCHTPTNEIKYEIFGCVKCPYTQKLEFVPGRLKAEPALCSICNP